MSDSGFDAEDSTTSTSILLGYAEEEPTEDPISQLGGRPKWMHPSSPPDSRLAKCLNCNNLMSLLLQLNGDIPEVPHERVFYVWACRQRRCWRKPGAVRAFRGVKYHIPPPQKSSPPPPNPTPPHPKPSINTGAFLFGAAPTPTTISNPNPFSTLPTHSTPNSPQIEAVTKTFAETLKVGIPPPPPPKEDTLFYGPAEAWPELPHVYPSYHLDAEHEHLDTRAPSLPKNVPIVDTDEYADIPMSNSTEGSESNVDKTFQKFADRVSQNPEQVLRYERHGTPLLYSKGDEVGKMLLDTKGEFTTRKIPACGNCRKPGSRVFEFQLMPYAISMLERDEMGLDGMEWGTIIVATCVCVPKVLDANGVEYIEEWAGVQWESLTTK